MNAKRRPRRLGPLIHALYLNAGLLAVIVVVLLMRGNGPGLASPAFGAPQMAPIAGGGGVFLMPAQFSVNTWGCYLMDIDTQNICAYQYYPGDRQLRFVAARNYREDRRLGDWNTSPHPAEVAHLVEVEKSAIRGAARNPEQAPPAGQAPDFVPPAGPDSAVPPVPSTGPGQDPATGSEQAPLAPSTLPHVTTHPWTPDAPAAQAGDTTKPVDAKDLPTQPATKGQ